MPISDEYLVYVLDQLRDLRGVTSRRMFGGAGLYSDGVIFAVVDDDQVFFRVDDLTRPRYLAAGCAAWEPMPGREKPSQGYYQLPAEVLDDREAASSWGQEAVAAAARKRVARRKPAKPKKKSAAKNPVKKTSVSAKKGRRR